MQYTQYILEKDKDTLLGIGFNTNNFVVNAYFDESYYSNTSIIYSRFGESNKPCLKIPTSKIRVSFLEQIESGNRYCNIGIRNWRSELDRKLKMLLLFS